jgi:predicted Zn-dependent protease with MMP-like domain
MTDWTDARAPSLDDFVRLAEAAFAALPAGFRRMTGDVMFRVQDWADEDTLDALDIDDALELTGLYHGVDLARRSVLDPAPMASMVFLYRMPILYEWAERGEIPLGELITHVLVHEIGHHFGLSDAQIDAIEAQA